MFRRRRLHRLEVWDGDFDFGAYDCSTYDTDDPDTPNDVLPPWADPASEAVYEGVAQGKVWPSVGCTTSGDPSDDTMDGFKVRSPSVTYTLTDSSGHDFVNDNPSGNQEWEDFSISTSRHDAHDFKVRSIPSGVYHLHVDGLDMDNFSFFRLPYETLCVRADGSPCVPFNDNSCTRTQGYWKQWRKPWPVDSITIGGTVYSRSEAQQIMGTAGHGDKTYDLFKQLVAAKLNLIGWNSDSCIAADLTAADLWMADHPVGSNVDASSGAWQEISSAHEQLDQYNNGQLECAQHCGDGGGGGCGGGGGVVGAGTSLKPLTCNVSFAGPGNRARGLLVSAASKSLLLL